MTKLLYLLIDLLNVIVHEPLHNLPQGRTHKQCFLEIHFAQIACCTFVLVFAIRVNVEVVVNCHLCLGNRPIIIRRSSQLQLLVHVVDVRDHVAVQIYCQVNQLQDFGNI